MSMIRELEFVELAFVVNAEAHNPTLLNPDFLKWNKIVPESWEVKGNPICAFPIAQVQFTNGFGILAQAERLIFTEILSSQDCDSSQLASVVCLYLEKLPHVNYKQLGFNPKCFIPVANLDKEGLEAKMLNGGRWLTYKGNDVDDVTIKLTFETSEYLLTMTMDQVSLPEQDASDSRTGLLISANFHHDLSTLPSKSRLQVLTNTVNDWEAELNDLRDYVESCLMMGPTGKKKHA